MATLREYYDADFNYAARIHIKLKDSDGQNIEGAVLLDFAGNTSLLIFYVPGANRSLQYFCNLIATAAPGGRVEFNDKITLPSARQFPGMFQLITGDVEIKVRFHGEPDWISSKQINTSRRIFIYSETQLREDEITKLKEYGFTLGDQDRQEVQFRSLIHATERSKFEKPLAFICHDSRDKEAVAKKIAAALQSYMCPTWYDEYSLSVGDNLHDKIMEGIKNCKKCILVLSPNFFSNGGWTKKEFDSIFTKEVIEQKQIVLPVWYEVSQKEVYEYSPSLANVLGLDWNKIGENEVCRRLTNKILLGEDA